MNITETLKLCVCVLLLAMISPIKATEVAQVSDKLILSFEKKLDEAGLEPSVDDPKSLSGIIKWAKKEALLPHCKYWLEFHLSQFPDKLHLRMALSDVQFAMQDWNSIIEGFEQDDWGEFDHVRLMYLSVAYRSQQNPKWEEYWNASKESAKDIPSKTESLIRYLAQWKSWDSELENLLWEVIDEGSSLKTLAFNGLVKLYTLQHNANGLLLVNNALLKLDPKNPELLNNHVSIHVLTNQIESIDTEYLNDFLEIANDSSKSELTLALYHYMNASTGAVKSYLESVPETSWKESDYKPYLLFLAKRLGFEIPVESDEHNFESLVESSEELLNFEKTFLLQE